MASSFEPSLSTSGMRPPIASPNAPSMADSLPSINFGFEDLRNSMAQFTVKFDAFIERGRKRVLEERNQFHINLAEYEGMNLRLPPYLLTVVSNTVWQRMSACDSVISKSSI